ncbi:hypothetical protein CROQUDRAFT_110520 [Cronartium quercuum f. sp. fusiforme G11]|uniref:Chromo domain-containing protein n=1 Tax=Cronartium quercuum f. sp. fusiforme G11 TaxID=708437 RepID=A0A9P6T8C7_9BASI|nr:hypothetical protein CROQUDRAFT_110520 [Cronartium quercuum f. sp. fusiforme G11]
MTTLATGLPIDRTINSKITPALRLSIQKATSAFQKDYCYDFLQAFVDEPEVADPIGIRVFLNYCLKNPESLIESWLDSIDQNVDLTDLNNSADPILTELDNFLEFIHGFIEIIELGEIFKLAYHEIDAWNLCKKLLEVIQRRLYELAKLDKENQNDQNELIIGSEDSNSAFYQAFISLDKFLKHTFDSRVLLEPGKLVDQLSELNERKIEIQSFKSQFPLNLSSTSLIKKFGRFGREESSIDNFLLSDKFKELMKLKNSMSGAQLTRQPSTRVRKSIANGSNEIQQPQPQPQPSKQKQRTSTSNTPKNNSSKSNTESTSHIDPFLREADASPPVGKIAFADAPRSSPSSQDFIATPEPTAIKTELIQKPSESSSSTSKKKAGRPKTSINGRRKRVRPPTNERDATINSTKRGRKSKSKLIKDDEVDDNGDVFVIEKIIGESVDQNGEKIYKVLWAGYPESDATWQFANTLDDCAAVDVWEEQKKVTITTDTKESNNTDRDAEGEDDEEDLNETALVKSPAALIMGNDSTSNDDSNSMALDNDFVDKDSIPVEVTKDAKVTTSTKVDSDENEK